eukprot:TRINITY_DN12664_c0_g1_i2.p1 TRINITY_DN12664_c0_g1~~TRINITY_DN12664_c0_g1_i2.p1  ORF type:complete len:199 (+),score=3.04 TRINITY_DN12664_c0_g1_i2:127-723(+)
MASRAVIVPCLLIAFAIFISSAAARIVNQVGPVQRVIPWPGKLRCTLKVDFDGNKVLSNSLGGDIGAHGDLIIKVFLYRKRINVNLMFNTHELSLPMPPLNQTINLGPQGSNGQVLWAIGGYWRQQNADQLKLSKWILGAGRKKVEGSNMSVYQLIKQIDQNTFGHYASVQTDIYPEGAMRGQFYRGWPNMAYPNPRC